MIRLRYMGLSPRDGWTPNEERDVENDAAADLVATGAWVVAQVAPRVEQPPVHRRVASLGGDPWR